MFLRLFSVSPVLDVRLLCHISGPKKSYLPRQEEVGDRDQCQSSHDGGGLGQLITCLGFYFQNLNFTLSANLTRINIECYRCYRA